MPVCGMPTLPRRADCISGLAQLLFERQKAKRSIESYKSCLRIKWWSSAAGGLLFLSFIRKLRKDKNPVDHVDPV